MKIDEVRFASVSSPCQIVGLSAGFSRSVILIPPLICSPGHRQCLCVLGQVGCALPWRRSGDLQDVMLCPQLQRKALGSWCCHPAQVDPLTKGYPENPLLGLLAELRNLLQLFLDLPATAVQQLQLLFCSVEFPHPC